MTATGTREAIAARLERIFADRGFAEAGVADLRAASGVSLRTLYRHFPSRDAMVLAALDHRHGRFIAWLFDGLPAEGGGAAALDTVIERTGSWMRAEAGPGGCLYHDALAARPGDAALHARLAEHKREVGERLGRIAGRPDLTGPLMLIHEGLLQGWAWQGEAALDHARTLGRRLLAAD